VATPEQQALTMMRSVYEDGEAEINGRTYRFTKMTHKQRRKVFAFFSRVQGAVNAGDMSFIDAPDFGPVEKVIMDSITFEDSLLSRLGDAHFEDGDGYPEDYIPLISTAMAVISYPFLRGSRTA